MPVIDFAHCTIYENVCQTIKLTNHSILPQQFGFVGIPDVSVKYYDDDDDDEGDGDDDDDDLLLI